ncbi:MAG: hypothetical protein CR971_01690 [candidate division SR1 bacterium]|nr:MAG: hypothetical protein CR971_01690 [candidate division SR1 bacterium]
MPTIGGTGIILIVLGVLILYFIVSYNKIIKLKLRRENAFADIDVQLKLRFDLIGNLVNTVKGYASHEKETLTKLTEARTNFMNANGVEDKVNANNQLTGALKSLFAVSENYPDLKANTNFLELQAELSDIENKLAASRRYFNAATREYNTVIQVFPSNIIANMFGFNAYNYFELEGAEAEQIKQAPKVKF